MSASCQAGKTSAENADLEYICEFIHAREGNSTRLYVPCDSRGMPLDKSGPTIAAGFDLGQHAPHEVLSLGLSAELAEKLVPYCGRQGKEAIRFILERPLTLSAEEAARVNKAVMRRHLANVARRFLRELVLAGAEKTSARPAVCGFAGLPKEARAALASLLYQYGPNTGLARGIIVPLLYGEYREAARRLRDMADRAGYKYPARRRAEAALLDKAR